MYRSIPHGRSDSALAPPASTGGLNLDADGVARVRAVFTVLPVLHGLKSKNFTLRQDQNSANAAAEMLLQKNLEITEIKSSEARTLAASRAEDAKVTALISLADTEFSETGAERLSGSEASDQGCTLQ
jgi:hypothetical protein